MKRHRAPHRFDGGRDDGTEAIVGGQTIKKRLRLVSVFFQYPAESFCFRKQLRFVFQLGELVKPAVKRMEAGLKAQDGDQFLINGGEAICLNAQPVELPDKQSISEEHEKNDEQKANGQSRTDIKPR